MHFNNLKQHIPSIYLNSFYKRKVKLEQNFTILFNMILECVYNLIYFIFEYTTYLPTYTFIPYKFRINKTQSNSYNKKKNIQFISIVVWWCSLNLQQRNEKKQIKNKPTFKKNEK